jgi:hypothetical protein
MAKYNKHNKQAPIKPNSSPKTLKIKSVVRSGRKLS